MATLLNTRFTNYIGSGTASPKSGSGDARGAIRVYLESQDNSTNQSYIRIDHLVRTSLKSGASDRIDITSSYRCNNGSYGGAYQSKSKTEWTIPYNDGYHTIGTTYHYVDHSTDGSATLYVNGSISGHSAWYKSFNRTSAFSVALPTIPRATTITSFTWAKASGGAGLSRLTCNWATANTIDRIQYSLNGGAWTTVTGGGTSGGGFNISGLTPNTPYSLKIKVRRADTQIETESSVKSATTYDIAKITAAPSNNVNMDNNQTITYTNPSGASLETSVYRTNASTVIAAYRACSGTSYTFAFTNAEKTAFYNQIPSAKTLPLRFYLRTSDGLGNSWLHYAERTFQVFNANPTFTTWTYADLGGATTSGGARTTVTLTGNNQKIIKGYSNVKATITSANKMVAIKGATAIRYQLKIGTKPTATANYSPSSTVEMTVNAVDNSVMIVNAVDSRENSTPKAITASTYINYTPISISAATGTRTDGIGTQTTLAYNGTFFNASFGSVTNTIKSATYKFKKTTDVSYTDGTSVITPTPSGNTFSFSGLIKGDEGDGGVNGFDATYSYNIRVIVTDELSTRTFDFILGTGTPNIAIHQNGVAINQAYNETLGGALQVNGSITNRGSIVTNGLVQYSGDPNTTIETELLTIHANCPTNYTGSDFYYIFTTFYGGKGASNSRVQRAIAYGIEGSTRGKMFVRSNYAGTWHAWVEVINNNKITTTLGTDDATIPTSKAIRDIYKKTTLYTGSTALAPGDFNFSDTSGYDFIILYLTSNVNSSHYSCLFLQGGGYGYAFVNEYNVQKNLTYRIYSEKLLVTAYTGVWILSNIIGIKLG